MCIRDRDINIVNELPYNQEETKFKIAEDEDFKIFYKINTGLANVRSHQVQKKARL